MYASFAITLVAFSFDGIEVVGVTAFEARNLQDLRNPSRLIAYLVFYVYFSYAVSETLNVEWNHHNLGLAFQVAPADGNLPASDPLLIIAAKRANLNDLISFLIVFLIFAALSASNTSLYVASRTLYGLARTGRNRSTRWGRFCEWLSFETSKGVPIWCVVVSGICFYWLPFTQLLQNQATEDVRLDLPSAHAARANHTLHFVS